MVKVLITNILGLILIVTNSAKAQPGPYYGTAQTSKVRTWLATAPEVNGDALINRSLQDVKLNTMYIDGLGRPIQQVSKKTSMETGGSPFDLITTMTYDEYGRERFRYLPFVASTSDGSFQYDPFQQQSSFMNTHFGAQSESSFYSRTDFEFNPLNRPVKTLAPGVNWVGSDRGVQNNYWLNAAADSVIQYNVINSQTPGSWGSYNYNGIFPAGSLYANAILDEHGKYVIEYKDKEGKVILKKVQLTSTSSAYEGWLCTYYIYDDLGNLRCVVQPRGVELLQAANWAFNSSILNEQAFRYEYDTRNRLIVKKVPGADPLQMVYDGRDRLVMTQDGKMNGTQWLITKYDELNRPVETGLWANGTDANTHRNNANNSINYPSTSGTYDILTKTHYDDYTNLPSALSASFLTTWNSYFASTDNSNFPYPQMPVQSSDTRGMVTWMESRVLGSNPVQWISSCSIYDSKGRVIQVQSTNVSGGVDVFSSQYSWSGQPLLTVQKLVKSGNNNQTIVVLSKFTYDDLGRMTKLEKRSSHSDINNGTMPAVWTVINSLSYNKIGQLKTKVVAPSYNNNNGLETMQYDYNIRGWILGVNRTYVGSTGQVGSTKFGFDLGYDKVSNSSGRNYTLPQYNGNISGMVWKSDGDDVKRKYDFSYDPANRLLKGSFEQDNSVNTWNYSTINYYMQMGDGNDPVTAYDANGNIKKMSQWGWKLGGSSEIDQLVYNYEDNENSNKLSKVTDNHNDPNTKLGDFHDGTNSAVPDYSYDSNGNLVKDENKGISTITYNYLNLPSTITVTGKGTIAYTYDASGNKLKKQVTEGSTITTTTYISTAVFQNDTLQQIGMEEGRIRFKPASGNIASSFKYDYMLKDHLGNVRMVLTEETRTDQYPAATMETASATVEESFYNYLPETRVDPPSGYPDNTPNGNAKVARLRGNTEFMSQGYEVGPGILLRVMSGDSINVIANSWWSNKIAPAGNGSSTGINQLLAAISGSNVITQQHLNPGQVQSSGELSSVVNMFLGNQTWNSSYPKAFLNWLAFDDQFNYVSGSSGFIQVEGSGTYSTLNQNGIPMTKNGYIYVYVSNASYNLDVFFDNLQVTHTRGPILEETHYYPFGLTMAGISCKALNGTQESKNKFQGQEFNEAFDVDYYEFRYRQHDPQIGRFTQKDPLSDQYVYNSTYAFSENKVINAVELEGLESVLITNTYNNEGKITNTSTINNKEDNYGPLGNGTYTVNKKADGTFTEEFKPGKGNSVNGFYQEGISQSRWIEGNKQGGYSTRLGARLIEKITEDGLVAMGFDEKQVQKDVVVLETDDKRFKGKFAAFAASDVVGRYTNGWESSSPSSPHKSNLAYESAELFSSDVGIKIYDGTKSPTDNIDTHIGLVRKGAFDHRSEALDATIFGNSVNIGLRNASRVKGSQENK